MCVVISALCGVWEQDGGGDFAPCLLLDPREEGAAGALVAGDDAVNVRGGGADASGERALREASFSAVGANGVFHSAKFAQSERNVNPSVRYLGNDMAQERPYPAGMKLRIRELRKSHGLTLDQLAERVGMTKGHLSEVERGLKSVMPHRLDALSRELGVEPHELLSSSLADGLTPKLRAHLRTMARLSPEQQETIARLAEQMAPPPPDDAG